MRVVATGAATGIGASVTCMKNNLCAVWRLTGKSLNENYIFDDTRDTMTFFFILQIKDCIFPETTEDNLIHVAGHFNSVLTACKPCSP